MGLFTLVTGRYDEASCSICVRLLVKSPRNVLEWHLKPGSRPDIPILKGLIVVRSRRIFHQVGDTTTSRIDFAGCCIRPRRKLEAKEQLVTMTDFSAPLVNKLGTYTCLNLILSFRKVTKSRQTTRDQKKHPRVQPRFSYQCEESLTIPATPQQARDRWKSIYHTVGSLKLLHLLAYSFTKSSFTTRPSRQF